jgi:predicted transposase YbfD/YdcC
MDFTMPALVLPSGDQPLLIDLQALHAALAAIPDRRHRRGIRYPLDVLLTIAVLGKLAGYCQLGAIAEWAHLRRVELSACFGLARTTMPHPTTWSRVFASAVDPTLLDQAIQQFFRPAPRTTPTPGRLVQVCIDGKTLAGTIPLGATQGLHLVAAYLPEQGVALLQLAVQKKANELTVAPTLLAQIALAGRVVTGDALFAQRNLSTQIIAAAGAYIWQVRRNQRQLYEDIALLFAPLRADERASDFDFSTVTTVDKGHGRLEERTLRTSSLLKGYSDWPGLAQVFEVTSTVRDGRGKVTTQVRYGVTSLPSSVVSARQLLGLVRQHWRIENDLHYRRDVTLGEDRSQVRLGQAPQVLASLNNLVIGLSTRLGASNLASFQRQFTHAFDKMLYARADDATHTAARHPRLLRSSAAPSVERQSARAAA